MKQTRMPLSQVRDFLAAVQTGNIIFALAKPVVPTGYANPAIRLIFVPGNGIYRLRAAIEGEVREIELKTGDLLCCLPNSCVQRINAPENNPISVVFMQQYIRFVWQPLGTDGNSTLFYHTRHALSPGGHLLLRGLLAFARENRPPEMLAHAAEALFDTIRDDLTRDMDGESKAMRTYHDALQLMQNRFQGDISRDDIAAALKITPTHLSRLFKQFAVKGFNDTLTRMRLEYAAELIRESRLPLDEIAGQSGFQSTSYFIKVFRKYHGVTPAHFRQ